MLRQPIAALLQKEHISSAAVIPFSACHVWQERKLTQLGFDNASAQSVLMLLIPYYVGEFPGRQISLYAIGRDYHVYFRELFSRLCPALEALYPEYRFRGSADNAPIDERHAALTAGLGILGDNGLLIHPEYGTYVFLGEIFSDLPPQAWYERPEDVILHPIAHCEHCGACKRACPMHGNNPYGIDDCLSAVTQEKHLTDPAYLRYIRYYDTAWGCDRCQSVCPHNKSPVPSPIPFWQEALLPYPTAAEIEAMPEDVFASRAYAWRKRATILRNLQMLEADAQAGGITLATADAIMNAMREAGAVMCRAHDVESIVDGIEEKPGSANFVTVYDVKVQNMLLERLGTILPDAQYFAEEKENDASLLEDGYCFIIDPIDGTTNFIHNYGGMSAISVGLFYRGTAVFGAIYDPYREDMYHARAGLGAFLNGKRISVSHRSAEKAVYAVGTSPYYKDTLTDRTFAMMKALYLSGADIRRCGSAALDLAAVACGKLDGFAELILSPWDYAAGALLIKEAGGIVHQPDGTPLRYDKPCPVAAGTENTIEILCRAAGL